MDTITELLKRDPLRQKALKAVAELTLPQCYLAAGFVRNLVWDHLHHKSVPTPLNDVDVIYFDTEECDSERYLQYEKALRSRMPELNWQVRNQAKMHTRNGDLPYTSSVDAMSFWPEKETAVGVRMNEAGGYELVSAFGVDSLFNLNITHNTKRTLTVFEQRVATKNWLVQWPKLEVRS
ncbi:nucleotidyltransferase family protein [Vibrio sp. S9_S30]|uniref:nucleotidyltransferase family protein n=1 Tax=Vibrio sp. S9_S30 TaxID=2720226 RepID=UPI00168088B4|nr:nucleotidyltransferase family protein [Vibrio sp. S9_S30]MBD1556420.1 nucleotidyltransferase family protein [Vibrio sp. S9_S30]